MKYTCKPCNYSTDNLYNFNKHHTTKKHAQKSGSVSKTATKLNPNRIQTESNVNQKQYLCSYCGTIYSTSSNLSKHTRKCLQKQNELQNLKKNLDEKDKTMIVMKLEFENKMTEMMLKLQNYEKEIEYLKESKADFKEENKYHKDPVLNAGKMTQTSLNAVNQIVNNFRNAHAITHFSSFELLEQDNEKLGDGE